MPLLQPINHRLWHHLPLHQNIIFSHLLWATRQPPVTINLRLHSTYNWKATTMGTVLGTVIRSPYLLMATQLMTCHWNNVWWKLQLQTSILQQLHQILALNTTHFLLLLATPVPPYKSLTTRRVSFYNLSPVLLYRKDVSMCTSWILMQAKAESKCVLCVIKFDLHCQYQHCARIQTHSKCSKNITFEWKNTCGKKTKMRLSSSDFMVKQTPETKRH